MTQVHEIFHQWYGNSLTAANWDDVWLHEGFAKYSEALWAEHTLGYLGYTFKVTEFFNKSVLESFSNGPMIGLEPGAYLSRQIQQLCYCMSQPTRLVQQHSMYSVWKLAMISSSRSFVPSTRIMPMAMLPQKISSHWLRNSLDVT